LKTHTYTIGTGRLTLAAVGATILGFLVFGIFGAALIASIFAAISWRRRSPFAIRLGLLALATALLASTVIIAIDTHFAVGHLIVF
jgi:hypothetical protein